MLKRYIEVSLQKEGIHCWPDAVNHFGIEFLASPHRHIFYIYVKMQVYSNDREVEFILFKRWIESLSTEGTLEFKNKSCEMIGENLINIITDMYGKDREITVRVYEDNENGAVIDYTPETPNNYINDTGKFPNDIKYIANNEAEVAYPSEHERFDVV